MSADRTLTIDGVTLSPTTDDRAWTYLPVRPVIERAATGEPMFSIIEAGPVAFLQCTARLALHEDVRARLLERLKAQRPDADRLEPAGIVVGRIALEINDGNAWTAISESTGSGMPPWNAAFAATLAPAALAAVKAAAAGESGHVRLTASYTPVGAPAAYRHSVSTGVTTLETTSGVFASGYSTATQESPLAGASDERVISTDLSIELASGGGGSR